ncbi:MAG: carbohydrate binding family 9 domain-containing protein [Bacteroidetes bacterium]|nr:carbohydrate binding family 9 domain-containing protein [Bacteroidota bacterium]
MCRLLFAKSLTILICILYPAICLFAQNQDLSKPSDNSNMPEAPFIHLKKTTETIKLDGALDEASWFVGIPAKDFVQYFPTDSTQAENQTEIYMTYDEDHLYVGVKSYTTGNDFVIPSLKRDYGFGGNDNLSILFDTYNDKTNAFLFGLNPLGVRREALISNGGRSRGSFSSAWDNKWDGTSKIYDGYWIAEFEIPFNTLRFNEGSKKWRFNCYRNDAQINEYSTWIRIPQNQIIMDLTYMGDMIWDEPLTKKGGNVSIIPYVGGGIIRDYEDETQTKPDGTWDIGGDAKIAVTSGLNLDLTVNPDFSQVEVDQQVTNLGRFEIFFPERRQFFLENADLFGGFGLRSVNPFFSRRIGVAQDTSTEINIQNTIYHGARLSGKLNENFRVGVLNMQTAKDGNAALPSFNYSVASLQHKVFDRSSINFIFVNKQAINPENGDPEVFSEYNRVGGLEYRVASKDNRLAGKAFYYQSFEPEKNTEQYFSHGIQLEYLRRNYRVEWAQLFVGNGFNAEVGFVPRNDYMLMSPEVQWYFYPQKGMLNRHGPGFDYNIYLKVGKDGNEYLDSYARSDQGIELYWDFRFQNNTRANIKYNHQYVFLFDDFDPTRVQEDDVFLAAGTEYNYSFFELEYNSDRRKIFSYRVEPTIGEFFNGFRAGVSGNFSFRYQPFGSIALSYNYNYIKLDAPFESSSLFLIGPRIDLTFTKKLFLTTFIQYNNQSENLNVNTRFQWRFQPVSDFFLVYTDNYGTNPFSERNRAIVAKLTYWLNL